MTDTKEPAFVAETLAWCNSIRAEKGQPPLDRLPKGGRRSPGSCPCGEATGYLVFRSTYSEDGISPNGILPVPVIDFVAAFDSGHLPQYEAGYQV